MVKFAAQDGVFLGKEEDEMLLLVGGGYVHVAPVSFLEWRIHKLEANVARVFKTPFGMIFIFYFFIIFLLLGGTAA